MLAIAYALQVYDLFFNAIFFSAILGVILLGEARGPIFVFPRHLVGRLFLLECVLAVARRGPGTFVHSLIPAIYRSFTLIAFVLFTTGYNKKMVDACLLPLPVIVSIHDWY